MTITKGFQPDYCVAPGEVLEEYLDTRGFTKAGFARDCGVSSKHIHQILNGRAALTPKFSMRISRVLHTSPELWNNMEANYRLRFARKQEEDEFSQQAEWAREFDVSALVQRGFIKKPGNDAEKIDALLCFFGVGTIDAWSQEYGQRLLAHSRQSRTLKSDKKAVATWLRIGELRAQSVETAPYDKTDFQEALQQMRTLTGTDPDTFQQKLVDVCAKNGVAVVFEPEIKGTRLSGATRWLKPEKALIMLSLRHKTDDHFWFTFFHEAAHILLHGKTQVFIDESDGAMNKKEAEADEWAEDFLIPRKEYETFVDKGRFDRKNIKIFAREQGVAPGIVLGRLQKEKLVAWQHKDNDLKRRFEFREEKAAV